MNKKFYALGRMKSGEMNRTEARYGEHLEALKQAGVVLWYAFEGITLKLAEGSRYTPDFLVMKSDGVLEVHEVKSHWVGDAKTKIKVAAEKFPFVFKAMYAQPKSKGGGWLEEAF